MKLIKTVLPDDCTIIDTGDWHIGASSCHFAGIKKCIERVKQTNTFVILKGDLIEAIGPADKRFLFESHDPNLPTVQKQILYLVDLLTPIKGKTLCALTGNHEWSKSTKNIYSPIDDLCRRLGIPYGTSLATIQATDKSGKLRFKLFVEHGSGNPPVSNAKDAVQRMANQLAALKQKFVRRGIDDCIYMSMGHIHRGLIVNPTLENELSIGTSLNGKITQSYRVHLKQNTDYIPPDARWYASSPAFLKLYSDPDCGESSYGEIRGYAPSELGWLELDIIKGELKNVRKVVV